MSNIELAAKYRQQLSEYLRNDYHVGSIDGKVYQSNKRDKQTDIFVINAYTRSIINLGLKPDTEQVIKEAKHNNKACKYRLMGLKTLEACSYTAFKAVTHVIKNKSKYMGKKINTEEFSSFKLLKNHEGTIAGIGKNSICVIDSKGHKTFFWYLTPPLKYNDTNGQGIELAKYLIQKYGE